MTEETALTSLYLLWTTQGGACGFALGVGDFETADFTARDFLEES